MNKQRKTVLGIDTSNYKTSVAIIDEEENIIFQEQRFLEVKKGERGLRQSTALFQHVLQLPDLLENAFKALPNEWRISAIAVSDKPRPVEGSYMPVFHAGVSSARGLAAALDVPCYTFSHQEGHIEAVRYHSAFRNMDKFICFHFSGGTTEALLVQGDQIEIVGGSKDLAFGQVLDRLGVSCGMDFPCGEEMDSIACAYGRVKGNILPRIKCEEGFINLSGIETKCQRSLADVDRETLITMTFDRLADAIVQMCRCLAEKYRTKGFLFAGGVSSSKYIRQYLNAALLDYQIGFGDPNLSTDNAVGIALLGGKKIWL